MIKLRMDQLAMVNLMLGKNHLPRDLRISRLEPMYSNAEIYLLLIVMVNQIHIFVFGTLAKLYRKPDISKITLTHFIMRLLSSSMKPIRLRIFLLLFLIFMIKISTH